MDDDIMLLKKFRFSRVFRSVLLVMVLAFSLTASAVTGVNLIGASPSDRDVTQTNQNYGYDANLPLILSFDTAADATTVLTTDVTLTIAATATLVPFTLVFSTDTNAFGLALNPNEVIVSATLEEGTIYNLTYVPNNITINFITKTTGTGGGNASPRLCVGRIVNTTDPGFEGVAVGTVLVPQDQIFRYAFTNAIPATTANNNAINMFQWIGAGAAPDKATVAAGLAAAGFSPSFFTGDPTDWAEIDLTVTFNAGANQALRQMFSFVPTGGPLTDGGVYAMLIDTTLASNGGNNPNLQQAVFEYFTVGSVLLNQ